MEHSVVFGRSHGPGHRLEGRSAPLLRYRLGAQNTTFCTAGQRPHADPPSEHNGSYMRGWQRLVDRIV